MFAEPRVVLEGDKTEAAGYYGTAKKFLSEVKRDLQFKTGMQIGDLFQLSRRKPLGNGAYIDVQIIGNLQEIKIFVPEAEPIVEIVRDETIEGGNLFYVLPARLIYRHGALWVYSQYMYSVYDIKKKRTATNIPNATGDGYMNFPCHRDELTHWIADSELDDFVPPMFPKATMNGINDRCGSEKVDWDAPGYPWGHDSVCRMGDEKSASGSRVNVCIDTGGDLKTFTDTSLFQCFQQQHYDDAYKPGYLTCCYNYGSNCEERGFLMGTWHWTKDGYINRSISIKSGSIGASYGYKGESDFWLTTPKTNHFLGFTYGFPGHFGCYSQFDAVLKNYASEMDKSKTRELRHNVGCSPGSPVLYDQSYISRETLMVSKNSVQNVTNAEYHTPLGRFSIPDIYKNQQSVYEMVDDNPMFFNQTPTSQNVSGSKSYKNYSVATYQPNPQGFLWPDGHEFEGGNAYYAMKDDFIGYKPEDTTFVQIFGFHSMYFTKYTANPVLYDPYRPNQTPFEWRINGDIETWTEPMKFYASIESPGGNDVNEILNGFDIRTMERQPEFESFIGELAEAVIDNNPSFPDERSIGTILFGTKQRIVRYPFVRKDSI